MIDIINNWATEGYFRVTSLNLATKENRILVDRKNTIMYPATYIAARGLAGLTNPGITHLYLAYSNNSTYPTSNYVIDPEVPAFTLGGQFGCLRIPLTFPASITSATDASWNMVTFNILVNQPGAYAITTSATLDDEDSSFFEAGLISQTSATGGISNITNDKLFSRVMFEFLDYNPNFNLMVSWGIKLSI